MSSSSSGSVESGNIRLFFGWQGPRGERSHVGAVDLCLKKVDKKISVTIPHTVFSTELQWLEFTCQNKRDSSAMEGKGPAHTWLLSHATTEDVSSLTVPIDRMRTLRLSARIFKPSLSSSVMIRDLSGNLNRQEIVTRTNEEIPLTLPETFQSGGNYLLRIQSDEALSLRGDLCLVVDKEPEPSPTTSASSEATEESEPFIKDCEEVCDFCVRPLIGLARAQVLTILALQTSFLAKEKRPPTIALHTIPSEAEVQLFVKGILAALEHETITALARKIESLPNDARKESVAKEVLRDCFRAIGAKGLENIMRSFVAWAIQNSSSNSSSSSSSRGTSAASAPASSSSSSSSSSNAAGSSYSSEFEVVLTKNVAQFCKSCLDINSTI